MKIIKIYLVVATVLLLAGLGFGVYVWYTLQTLSVDTDKALTAPKENVPSNAVLEAVGKTQGETEEPAAVKTVNLSDSQQKILESFGFDAATVTVTSTMMECAENAVGTTRLQEILGGAAPTPLESVKLLPCFTA